MNKQKEAIQAVLNDAAYRDRFDAKVDAGAVYDCWEWTGEVTSGVGIFYVGKTKVRAHRLAWILHNGKPIPSGHDVGQKCGSRTCMNPAHLYTEPRSERNTGGGRKKSDAPKAETVVSRVGEMHVQILENFMKANKIKNRSKALRLMIEKYSESEK